MAADRKLYAVPTSIRRAFPEACRARGILGPARLPRSPVAAECGFDSWRRADSGRVVSWRRPRRSSRVALCLSVCAAHATVRFGNHPRSEVSRKSRTLRPISRAILPSKIGAMSRPRCIGTVVVRPSLCRNCLCDPRWRTSANPRARRRSMTPRGFRTGIELTRDQATISSSVPMNSACISGSPSSSNIEMTSLRFSLRSARSSPWLCAPGNPGTYPT